MHRMLKWEKRIEGRLLALSVFILKLIAVLSMFIDHLTYVLRLAGHLPYGNLYILGRAIGRPAFVIYCFLLVNGFEKTRDRRLYFRRLIAFAVISQLPFSLAFTRENYYALATAAFSFDLMKVLPLLAVSAVAFFCLCERRFDPLLGWMLAAFALSGVKLTVGGICLLDTHANVFYTLAAGFAAMLLLESFRAEDVRWPRALLLLAAFAAELFFLQQDADYGLIGVALIAALYLSREKRALQLLLAAVWCLAEYKLYWPYLGGALAALIPMAAYNGELGRKMRTAFYVFYPAHLALLGLVFLLLSRI